MGKVEMDISEYHSILETKKLLEDALSREKKLSESVEKLHEEINLQHQEKLEILEDSKTKAVIINKTTKRNIFKQLLPSHVVEPKFEYLLSRKRLNQSAEIYPLVNCLLRECFEEIETIEEDVPQTHTTGLDEFKNDLKIEFNASLSKETSDKLESLKIISNENKDLRDEIKQILLHNEELRKSLYKECEFGEKLNDLHNELNQKHDNYVSITKLLIEDVLAIIKKRKTFNKGSLLNEIQARLNRE